MGWMLGFGLVFMLLFGIIGILGFMFWIWMIVDCATRDFRNDMNKVVWILIILFLNVLGAVIYYFSIKSKSR